MKTNMKRLLALILALSMVMSLLSANVWAADSSGDASGASVASGDVSVQEEASGEGSDSNADGSESKTEDASASDTAEAEEDESKEDQSEPGEEESAPENQSDAEAEDDDEPKEDESEEEVSPEEEVTVQETVSNISYLEGKYENNTLTFTEKTASSCTVVEGSTTTWSSGWYVVNTPSTDNLTISSRITISGTVNLILCDGAKLIAQKGITTTGATLNIYAQSDGSGVLYAGTTDGSNQTCGDSVAGIGGNGNDIDGGSVNIHGGKVIARGGNGRNGGAGIGGGACGAGGGVIIYGGNVTATGGGKTFGAAGIGGGGSGDGDRTGTGGNVSIYGGTVTATGAPDYGMGIGRGEGANSNNNGNLTLGANVKLQVSTSNSNWRDSDGGVYNRERYMRAFYTPPVSYMAWDSDQNKLVKKTGDNACKNYEAVSDSTTSFGNGKWYVANGTVIISNRITVSGTANLILCDGAKMTASKGITTTGATLNIYEGWTGDRAASPTVGELVATGAANYNAGIGGLGSEEYDGGAGGTVNIHGGTVTATGHHVTGSGGAGIGGGFSEARTGGAGGTVTIYSGTVTATGGYKAAGIGGGDGNTGGAGGTVTIYGGTVTATGNGGGAGIGGGDGYTGGSGGTVTINGGTVTATGGSSAKGIGGGKGGPGGTLTLGKGVTLYGSDSSIPAGSGDTDLIASGPLAIDSSNSATYPFRRYIKAFKAPHTHSFTYSADGATITAVCDEDCDLPVVNQKPTATLTIGAPEHQTTGDGKSAEATLTDLNGIQGTATVSYYNANADGTDKDGAALTAVPTDGGRYWAEITLTNADNGSTATAHVVYEIADPDYAISVTEGIENGTVTADKDSARFNEVVTLTAAPADDDHVLRTLTVKDKGGKDVTVTDNQFTMPASDVTVSATFAEKTSAAVALTVNQVNEKGGTACLLKEDFAPLGESAQVREGDRFILCVTKEEEYDFTTAFSPDAVKEEFSKEDYEGYLAYANSEEIAVSPGMVLYWVTMPCVESGSLSATVTFIEPKTYTILYQPQSGTSPDMVFCKIGTEQQGEVVKFGRMRSGAKMGSDTVWTMTITSMVQPTKLAFIGSNSAATDEEMTALANSVKDAAMSNAVLSQTANPSWTDVAGGKYLLIGGNAKVVTAVFVSDPNAISTFKDNAFDEAEATEGVSYQFAVVTDGSGTVTAPAAPARDGYTFGGWRGVENQKEKVYEAGDSVSISEDTTLNAVWNRVNPTVTLNLNGGTGVSTSQTVGYNATLSLETPTRSGYAFDRWTVSEAVTESGTYFAKGSTFDFSKPITENLKLTAQWKHVHSYKCYKISVFGDKLAKYQKYEDVVHVAICDCKDIQLTAHEFDSSGKCKCGYTKPGTQDVTMNVSYGQWSNNQYTEKMKGMPETAKDGQEVSICAPGYWGDLEFSKWQYSTNGTDWYDLTADAYASFLIPCSLSVRALYINPVRDPTVELISRHYDDHAEINGQTWTMDNILYQMNYKLPDGCTFVDGGIKLGDNSGISYYFIQQVRMSYDNESKGIIAGMAAGMAGLGVLANALGGSGDPVGVIIDFATADYEEYRINYLETEDNVLDKMLTPKALAKQMYEGKPVNVEKYPPIYWEARVPTKGMSGSITTAPPLRFAQKNNQEHYIYGIAWMRYKQGGKIKTIYTDAIAPTAKNPTASASKSAQ